MENDEVEPGLGDRVAGALTCLNRVAAAHETSLISLAVAWVLGVEGVTGAICGARNPGQVDGWIEAADVPAQAVDELRTCLDEGRI